MQALQQVAAPLHVPMHSYGRHWLTKRAPDGMIYADMHGEVKLQMPSLLGVHQIVNAGNAIAALSALESYNVFPEHVITGLTQTKWKGRLQRIETSALPESSELWFDGGHNMAAAQAISLFVREHWQDKPTYLIFGTTQGKDIAQMLLPFQGLVKKIYGVSVKSEPKSYAADALVKLAPAGIEITPADSIADALSTMAEREAGPLRALVFGSLYLWLETTLV